MKKIKLLPKLAAIAAAAAIACAGTAGILMFYSGSTTVGNAFIASDYGMKLTETFVPPTSWKPGDVTDKIVGVTNSGNTAFAVRISIIEGWTDSGGAPVSSVFTFNGVEYRAAIPDFGTNVIDSAAYDSIDDALNAAKGKWLKYSGYYYYIGKVNPGDSTCALLESVTFNPLAGNTVSNSETTVFKNSSGETSKTVTTTKNAYGYDNSQYTLTVNAETVQLPAIADVFTEADPAIAQFIVSIN